MKKSLFILLALCGASFSQAASVHSNDYTWTNGAVDFSVDDASSLVSNSGIAFSFKLDKSLPELSSMSLSLIMGTGDKVSPAQSFRSDIEYTAPYVSLTANGYSPDLEPGMWLPVFPLDPSVSDYLVVNIDDDVTFSYYDYNTKQLCAILCVENAGMSKMPETIGTAQWSLSGSDLSASEFTTWNGVVLGSDIEKYIAKGVYWVASGDLSHLNNIESDSDYDADVTRVIGLKGGTLVVDDDLMPGVVISSVVKDATGGEVEITENNKLKRSNLSAEEGKEIKLSGGGDYYLETGLELGKGILLANSWTGTVYTGAIGAGVEGVNVNNLGNANSTVQLGESGNVTMVSLRAEQVGMVKTPGNLVLLGQSSKVQNLNVQGVLTLGNASGAARLDAAGQLQVQNGITLGHINSSISAAELLGTSLNIAISDSELQKLTNGSTAVLTLEEVYKGSITLNGCEGEYSFDGKTIYSLEWGAPVTRAAAGAVLSLHADVNAGYVKEKLARTVSSHNGYAGLSLLSNAFVESNPQINAPKGNLAALMNAVDAGAMTDTGLAAVAGASVTVLGQALGGDAERQLRAIRNRAVSGIEGSDTVVVKSIDAKGAEISTTATNAHKFSVWVNGEGNRTEQDADGTAAGYTLSSWGGTVGSGMQLNQQLTLGVALTAMRGDVKSEGADHLDGDMDTTYLSAFARYQRGAWSHCFIGTAGAMDSDYMRTVSFATDSYTASGDTEGSVLGLMYELSREFALSGKSRISPVFNISYRHTEVDGYSEGNSDAALLVGDQSLDTVTLGLGARYAAMVGAQTINRACALEARALVKYDVGDRQGDTMVGIAGQAARANVESAELGAFGVELGAGITVPTGPGSVFADGAVEVRDDYVDFNAAVGYKIQF